MRRNGVRFLAWSLAGIALLVGVAAAQSAAGKVKVQATLNGENVTLPVELLPVGEGPTAAVGESGTPFDAPAGTWRLRATLTQALDRPTRIQDGVQVVAGRTTALTVAFEVADATLLCRRGETDLPGEVKLRRPGASWLPAVRCGAPFQVSGGSYEAEATVQVDGGSVVVPVERLQLMAGATQRLTVRVP